jgi:hypothetical protein
MCNLHLQFTLILCCKAYVQELSNWYQNVQLKINCDPFSSANDGSTRVMKIFFSFSIQCVGKCYVTCRPSPPAGFISKISDRFTLNLAVNHALTFAVRNCFWSYKRAPYAEEHNASLSTLSRRKKRTLLLSYGIFSRV